MNGWMNDSFTKKKRNGWKIPADPRILFLGRVLMHEASAWEQRIDRRETRLLLRPTESKRFPSRRASPLYVSVCAVRARKIAGERAAGPSRSSPSAAVCVSDKSSPPPRVEPGLVLGWLPGWLGSTDVLVSFLSFFLSRPLLDRLETRERRGRAEGFPKRDKAGACTYPTHLGA